jgi:hypothetical protein
MKNRLLPLDILGTNYIRDASINHSASNFMRKFKVAFVSYLKSLVTQKVD